MDRPPEFAEQYSKTERVRFIALGATAGAVLILGGEHWLFPWLREFASSAQCRTVLGSNGATALWYGMFAALPLFAAVVVACTVGLRGFKILRDGQVPPLREKAFRRIRIRRGSRAKVSGYLHAMAFVPLLATSLWGGVQAAAWSKQALHEPVSCRANHSFKPSPLRGSASSRR
jgi:hypothetical protein